MAQTFAWNDERIELVQGDDMLVAEVRWVEKQSKVALEQMGSADSLVARVVVSLKRRNIHLAWAEFDNMSLGSFDIQADDEDEPDPTTPEGASVEKPSAASAKSGGSSS